VAHRLETEGLVSSACLLEILAWMEGRRAGVEAGEFALAPGQRPEKILKTLVCGRQMLHRLTIPEGLTIRQTAHLADRAGLTRKKDFTAWAQNATWVRSLGIPANSAEGYLWPETYYFPRSIKDNPWEMIKSMVDQFTRQAKPEFAEAGITDPEKIHALLILASLVEKESALPEERRRIAGVFTNRLRRTMRLQCDPTVIYGLGQSFDGNLTREHLKDGDNIYNTYRHSGLPPGPICSVGLESIQAAITPEDHDYLYFVSRGDGSHQFSQTLKEHNRAVNRHQKRRP
jgi:UPF0755 protein